LRREYRRVVRLPQCSKTLLGQGAAESTPWVAGRSFGVGCAHDLAVGANDYRPWVVGRATTPRLKTLSRTSNLPLDRRTIRELCSLFVPSKERVMVRAVAEEALALTTIVLFLAMVAVWTSVLGVV